ncbi:MAG TPA: hypothetical protein VFQ38_21060 [Longimicrobiales bacterium]|nr:hypothetical protein [Longimicrobiales bacterium]
MLASPSNPDESIARAVALALADPALRTQVLEDMRDSPFREKKLHLRSYLRGGGEGLAVAAARSAGMAEADLLHLLDAGRDLEFYMPVPAHKLTWKGTPDVIVVATTMRDSELRRLGATELTGYDTHGQPVRVPLRKPTTAPLLSIVPVETSFGSDPEGIRRRAPHRPDDVIGLQIACTTDCPWDSGDIGFIRSRPRSAASGSPGQVAARPGEVVGIQQDCTEDCSGGGGGTPTPVSGFYMDFWQAYFAGWSYDSVPFGSPEFEIYLGKYNPNNGLYDSPLDAYGDPPCAGDSRATWSYKYFDYNDPPNTYYRDFLIARGDASDLETRYASTSYSAEVFFIDNDDTGCPLAGEPSIAWFGNGNNLDNDDDFLGAVGLPFGTTTTPYYWMNPYTTSDPALFQLAFATNRTF